MSAFGYGVIKVPVDGSGLFSKFEDEDILGHFRKKGAEFITVFTYFGHARGEAPIRLQLYSSLTDPDKKFLDAAEVQDAIGEREFVKLVFLSGCYTIDPIEQKPSLAGMVMLHRKTRQSLRACSGITRRIALRFKGPLVRRRNTMSRLTPRTTKLPAPHR